MGGQRLDASGLHPGYRDRLRNRRIPDQLAVHRGAFPPQEEGVRSPSGQHQLHMFLHQRQDFRRSPEQFGVTRSFLAVRVCFGVCSHLYVSLCARNEGSRPARNEGTFEWDAIA